MDEDMQPIRSVSTVGRVTNTNGHDFLITEDDTFLFISYYEAIRDFSGFDDQHGNPYPAGRVVKDSVIQEVDQSGAQLFLLELVGAPEHPADRHRLPRQRWYQR